MSGHVLVVNAGSSSVKLALVDPDDGTRTLTALAERLGGPEAALHVRRGPDGPDSPDGTDEVHETGDLTAATAIERLVDGLTDDERADLLGVGHRVVHGGRHFSASVVVDDTVREELDGLVALAPLHMPSNLRGVDVARRTLPDLTHVAVFDTAFHQTMEPVAYRYAVPASWYDELGVRRYGFHGTSHRYVSERAAQLLGRPPAGLRLVTLHLGNGCSAAAVVGGRSVDTTMGLTPLEGLVMGTRSGDVDPGVIGYVASQLGCEPGEVLDALNSRSGLLGLSGLSNDMRTLTKAAAGGGPEAADAALAVAVFCRRVAKSVGALAVAMGGLDAVVFTGGIGEHAAVVRHQVLEQLGVLGVREDPAANAAHGRHTGGHVGRTDAVSPVAALVVPTDEELVIARDTAALAAGQEVP